MNAKNISISLTDDHIIVRKGFKDIINAFGSYEVTMEADNGEELLRKLKTSQPDICIIDISMPKMNGYETMLEIKKTYPALKVLVMTMYNNEFAVLKMLRSGANGYLLKNCNPGDLKTALQSIYTSGYYHSDFVTSRIFRSIEKEKDSFPKITDKELRFLELCCRDITYKEMGDIMICSPRTVESHRDTLFQKLNVRTRTALVMYAIQMGVVSFSDKLD